MTWGQAYPLPGGRGSISVALQKCQVILLSPGPSKQVEGDNAPPSFDQQGLLSIDRHCIPRKQSPVLSAGQRDTIQILWW